jgi:uncharacterized coiled-coil DUF342 family protein
MTIEQEYSNIQKKIIELMQEISKKHEAIAKLTKSRDKLKKKMQEKR